MKKIIIFVLMLFYAININASVVVMDADSGRILYSENKDERKLIASTTKIMTTLIALENSNIKKEVEVKDEILKVNGSMIYSKIGEKYTIEDLLYGLMLRSGNDAAMTIATNVLGYNEFINKMNLKAIEIGMFNTTFENPHGLNDDTKNYSTANDLALLMKYALKNKEFVKITSTKKYKNWLNKNDLLFDYKYLITGKIGYTKKSGQVYVSSASKNNKNLIIASIDEDDKYELHKNLYEKYFENYKKYKVLNKYTFSFKSKKDNYHYYIKKDYDVLLTKDEIDKLKIKIDTNNNIINIFINDKKIHSERLYKVEEKTKKNLIEEILSFFR